MHKPVSKETFLRGVGFAVEVREGEAAAKVGAGLPDSSRPLCEWNGLGADVGGPGTRCRGVLAGWVAGPRPGVPARPTSHSVPL